jgi:multidrug transporter EmrE-like cation transporter
MTIYVGILLALACAFTSNLAFLYKYRGARAAPAVHVRHPLTSARGLFASPWFTIGMLVAVAAWTAHVGALALAPMSVVQAVLAGGVVLLAVMAERIFGFKVGPRQWAGLGLTALGLVLLGVTLPAVHSAHSQFSLPGMIAFEAGLLVLGALLIMGKRIGAPDHHHGVMLGAAAGILFGVSDVSIKAITGLVGSAGLLDALLSPWAFVARGASVAAFYASAKGLQDGEAVPVIAITGAAANVAGVAGGIVVFGDPLPGSALGIVMQALAFLLVIVAAVLTPAPVRATHAAATA